MPKKRKKTGILIACIAVVVLIGAGAFFAKDLFGAVKVSDIAIKK